MRVIDSNTPTVVYFYAKWCKSCRNMTSEIDELKVELNERTKLLYIDIDQPENYKITQAYNIYAVPTIIIFHNGAPAWRINGLVTASYLLRIVGKLSASAHSVDNATVRSHRK